MDIRRPVLLFVVLLTGWLPVDAQTVTGRYPHKAKRLAPRVAYVSICESRSAYAYHNGMCRGLARCTYGVSQVSVAQAKNRGDKPCKICY